MVLLVAMVTQSRTHKNTSVNIYILIHFVFVFHRKCDNFHFFFSLRCCHRRIKTKLKKMLSIESVFEL